MEKKRGNKRKVTIIIISVSLIIILFILIYLMMQIRPTYCGDGVCDIKESWQTCPEDCPIPLKKIPPKEISGCGDGVCEMPETNRNCPEDCKVVSWIQNYTKARKIAGISNQYLEETRHFDYGSKNIMEIVYDIKYNTGSAEEAVKKTAREVYLGISYVLLPGHDCERYTASEILAREYGLCSTMSKVNIAILRGLGIAARPVVGCASNKNSCQILSILPGINLPKIGPIRIEDGKGVVGGGIHAWVEVWLPEEGWVILESTNGMVYKNPKCTHYDIHMQNPNINNYCWIHDAGYVIDCKDDSLFE